jgi:hypothetical protein
MPEISEGELLVNYPLQTQLSWLLWVTLLGGLLIRVACVLLLLVRLLRCDDVDDEKEKKG